MAAGNTKFRAENGLDVVGGANVSGMLRVDGDLSVGGNLAFTLTTSGDLMPTSNQFFVGNTTNRWTIFALAGNFTNVDATSTASLNVATIATSIIPTANNKALGNTTSRWDFYGNNASLISANVGANVNLSTEQLSIGNTISNAVLNQTSFNLGTTTSNVQLTTSSLNLGNTTTGTINAFALNISGVTASGNTTVTGFVNVSSYGRFGGVVNATSFNSTGATTSTFANNVTVTGVSNTVSFNQTGATTSTFANNVTVTGVSNTVSFNQTGATTSTFANNVTISGTANVSTAVNVGANVNLSTEQLSIGSTTGNSVLTQSALTVGNSAVGTINAYALNIGTGNATFRTDLLTLDGTNNRIGLKTGLANLSTSALATVTGNIEFSTISTGIRLQTSNVSMNASVIMSGNTTNTRFTFNTFDSGTSNVIGGFSFTGTNSTATQTLLGINGSLLQYKSGNVAHSGNFGIYDVNGTRLGP